jgi:hypothetical protein
MRLAARAGLTCVVAIASLPAAAQYSPPSAGLVAWWRGEANANDSANSHDGTLEGGMGFTPGVYDQAFMAGSNQRAAVPDSPAFELTSLSIGAWVKATSTGYFVLMRGDNRGGLDPYSMGMDPDNGNRFQFRIEDGANNFTSLETADAQPLDEWIQYTVTLDGVSHDMRIYMNGVLAAETTALVTPLLALDSTEAPGIGIGNVQNTFDFPFQGAIDEVVLYDRALSPAEVASLVPEPGGCALLGLGCVAALGVRGWKLKGSKLLRPQR